VGTFKHHSYFPNEKVVKGYLLPNVCFVCRKCFKKPVAEKMNTCPNCGGKMVALNRKFSAPKSNDLVQWKKVQYLVENGFLFQSIYETENISGQGVSKIKVSYPENMEEAIEFVAKYRAQAE
jgi:hypothetical protein